MSEYWREIKEFPLYNISIDGKVINIKSGKILKGRKDKNGYKRVILYNKSGYKNKQIHRLVAEAFIPNPENKPQVDHIDTVRTNNNAGNLRWVTCRENNLNPLTMERYKKASRIPITDETKRKMSASWAHRVQHPQTAETRIKQSIARRNWWLKKKEVVIN